MIFPATLILAALVFNAASVLGAPIRAPAAQLSVRAMVDTPVARGIEFETVVPSARELESDIDTRDTASLPEIEQVYRRYPRRVLQEYYEKRSQPEVRDVAPEAGRRFARRELFERHAELEKRQAPPPAPLPSTPVLPAEVNAIVKTITESGDEFQTGQTKKTTYVVVNVVEHKSKGEAGEAPPVVPVPSASANVGVPTPVTPVVPTTEATAAPTVPVSIVEPASSATASATTTAAARGTEAPVVAPVVEPSVASSAAPEPTVTEAANGGKATETPAVPTTTTTGETATATTTGEAGEGGATTETTGTEAGVVRRSSGSAWASYLKNLL
jgi:hypothetical protein